MWANIHAGLNTLNQTCPQRDPQNLWTAVAGHWRKLAGDCQCRSNIDPRGCGLKLGLVYAAIPRLARYSRGLSEPRDILIRFSLYQWM